MRNVQSRHDTGGLSPAFYIRKPVLSKESPFENCDGLALRQIFSPNELGDSF